MGNEEICMGAGKGRLMHACGCFFNKETWKSL